MKPKEVAIVSNANNHRDGYEKYGIWWFNNLEEFRAHVETGGSPVSFEFLIIDNNVSTSVKKIEPFISLFPYRVLLHKDSTLKVKGWMKIDMDKLKRKKPEEVELFVWQEWLNGLIERKRIDKQSKPQLALFLLQDKDVSPTKEWKDLNIPPDEKLSLSVLARDHICIKDDCPIIMYDRHRIGFSAVDKNKLGFYQAIEKSSPDFESIFLPPGGLVMPYRLVECGLMKVLILDERVAEVAHEVVDIKVSDEKLMEFFDPDEKNPKRIQVAEKAGIYIGTDIELNSTNCEPVHTSLKDKSPRVKVSSKIEIINNGVRVKEFKVFFNGREINDFDILVVHQQVLQSFFSEYRHDDLLKALRKHIPYILVESGRGLTSDIPENAKFMPFSLLENYVMAEGIAKYSLIRFIMNLRRRRNR